MVDMESAVPPDIPSFTAEWTLKLEGSNALLTERGKWSLEARWNLESWAT